MAVKIRLKRLGKVRAPHYRIVISDARKKRDSRVIEEVGQYHPTEDPSFISVQSERIQYWLGVGAQPSEPVAAILKVTGDWQKHKGLPGAEGTLKTRELRPEAKEAVEAAEAKAAEHRKAAEKAEKKAAESKAAETKASEDSSAADATTEDAPAESTDES